MSLSSQKLMLLSMKKLSLTIIAGILIFLQQGLQAQTNYPDRFNKAVFVEAFGQGLHATINYDMRLIKGRQDGPGFRVGMGGIVTGSSDYDAGLLWTGVLGIPVGFNYLIGEKKSAFEAGIGLTPQKASTDLTSPTRPKVVNRNGWSTNGFINLGYRFQPIDNGFTFRFNWTPVISSTGFISRFGVSAGYAFK